MQSDVVCFLVVVCTVEHSGRCTLLQPRLRGWWRQRRKWKGRSRALSLLHVLGKEEEEEKTKKAEKLEIHCCTLHFSGSIPRGAEKNQLLGSKNPSISDN